MKKVLGILLALALVSAFAVPTMAQALDMAGVPGEVVTTVEVVGDASGSPPVSKAKWEKFSHYTDSGLVRENGELIGYEPWEYRQDYNLDYLTYDDDPTVPGIQVFPPGLADPQGEIDIEYWAVVTDLQDLADIVSVSADVHHPPEWVPQFPDLKYEVWMDQVFIEYWDADVKAQAFAELDAADAAGAITYGEGYDLDDLKWEYEKGEAWIFMGVEWLDYHQPYGWYTVDVWAADQGGLEAHLVNQFEYVQECSIELDFTTLSFGDVKVCKPVTIPGDEDMNTPDAPSVKNLGNCNTKINVRFDDMGFGWRTEDGKQVWNVGYDARLGLFEPIPLPGEPYIDPEIDIELPGELPLCNTLELDFSIHVSKATIGTYTGNCTIWCTPSPGP